MIKAIYKHIASCIEQVPEIRWVDIDLGQLDMVPPPVSWPCVLISFTESEHLDLLQKYQQGLYVVELRVGFRLRERTHTKAAQVYRDEALAHLVTLDRLHKALHHTSAPCITQVRRTAIENTLRGDYRVYIMRYAVVAYDGPDDPEYKVWKDYDPGPEGLEPCIEVVVTT